MLLFSTVLFVNGIPAVYHVYKEENRLLFSPAEREDTEVAAPVIYAEKKDNSWIITGTNDRDLVEQAIEDIMNDENKFRV